MKHSTFQTIKTLQGHQASVNMLNINNNTCGEKQGDIYKSYLVVSAKGGLKGY